MSETTLPLTSITIDPALNIREALDEATVRHYMDIFDRLPRPVIYRLPDGIYLLAAGFHRLEAAQRLGRAEVAVEVREGSRREAREFAILDNLTHGRPYSRAERRKAIEEWLKLYPERADSWIAADLCVSSHTVRAVREGLEATSQIAKLDRLMGADGKERPRELDRREGEAAPAPLLQVKALPAPDEVQPALVAPPQNGATPHNGIALPAIQAEEIASPHIIIPPVKSQRLIVHRADILDWATNYNGPRFHAGLSDPPYGLEFLSLGWDTPGQNGFRSRSNGASVERDTVFGRLSTTSPKYSAGLAYQQWVTEWAMALAENVFYPGAVCAFFGGTRTFHRLAAGLEDAGYEIFDTMLWLYGQGMSKGQNISKALDARAFSEWLESVPHGLSPRELRMVASAAIQGGIDPAAHGPAAGLLKEVVAAYWARPGLPPGIRRRVGEVQHHESGTIRQCVPRGTNIYDDRRPTSGFGLPITAANSLEASLWEGYNTSLKPAWEPIILCRAPYSGSILDITQEFGTGALNIDGCRIPIRDTSGVWGSSNAMCASSFNASPDRHEYRSQQHPGGRFPPNVIFESEAAGLLDQMSGLLKSGDGTVSRDSDKGWTGGWSDDKDRVQIAYADEGGASRFFYQAKTPQWEAHAGVEDWFWQRDPELPTGFRRIGQAEWQKLERNERGRGNIHPTRKPLQLVQRLARLLLPAEIGRRPRQEGVTAPRLVCAFNGSGSEMIGGHLGGFGQVEGVEMYGDYCSITNRRLSWWGRFEDYNEARRAYRRERRYEL